jgi:hypothetical protein
MSRQNTLRRAGAAVAGACLLTALSPISTLPVRAASDRLRLGFDGTFTAADQSSGAPVVSDSSGQGNHGVVRTAYKGAVLTVTDPAGNTAADFPGKCAIEPCPNALVEIADQPSLDPGTAPFQFGARVLLKKNETADGQNVVQKGTWGEPGGQWKLQIDKSAGVPSCVVSGRVPGKATERRVVLRASIGVADGVWHALLCRRTAAGVEILIDGVVRGSVAMPAVVLDSTAPVTIGAKAVAPKDNDQFHGVLDDVVMTVL